MASSCELRIINLAGHANATSIIKNELNMDENAELLKAMEIYAWCLKRMEMNTFITFEFRGGMISCVGKAWSFPKVNRGKIKLSRELWGRQTEAEKRDTIIHEIAHVLADVKFGRYNSDGPHGYKWKLVMNRLGIANPKRCHSLDRSDLRRRQTRYMATCPNCSEQWLISARKRTIWIKNNQHRVHFNCGYIMDRTVAQNAYVGLVVSGN